MGATSLADDIAALEASQDAASTPAAEALSEALAAKLEQTRESEGPEARSLAVRGLMVVGSQFYRTGQVARSRSMLHAALALSDGLGPDQRIAVALRCGELDLLTFDIAAALAHTARAMEIAHATGRRVDEARAWVNYGAALDSAGLYRQADEHWAHALDLLEGLDEPRLRGNIWALRCPLGFRLRPGEDEAAAQTCRKALECALATPARYRDSMACTALCNWAAVELQCGRVGAAREHLLQAASHANVGVRSLWLVAVLHAMADVRAHNEPGSRAALDALLQDEKAPAAVYVIETLAVMAAMYADMGDPVRASEALGRLSTERARALWAMLRGPKMAGRKPGVAFPHGEEGDEATGLLERLAVAAELRDDATGRHCFRVGRLARLLAQRAGLPAAAVEGVELAARLHDIGKLVIPDAILLKPGALDATELHLMQTHTVIGAEILAGGSVAAPEAARDIARHHHERWDGQGYPDGLAGEAIPIAARVAALADVYDALTHERPYKAAWSHEEAMAYIGGQGGAQFDPALTRHFVAMMEEAKADLRAFLGDLESAAAASAFVVAQSRVSPRLAEAGSS